MGLSNAVFYASNGRCHHSLHRIIHCDECIDITCAESSVSRTPSVGQFGILATWRSDPDVLLLWLDGAYLSFARCIFDVDSRGIRCWIKRISHCRNSRIADQLLCWRHPGAPFLQKNVGVIGAVLLATNHGGWHYWINWQCGRTFFAAILCAGPDDLFGLSVWGYRGFVSCFGFLDGCIPDI